MIINVNNSGSGGGSDLPPYTAADKNRFLAVNSTGTGLEWVDMSDIVFVQKVLSTSPYVSYGSQITITVEGEIQP